MSKLKVGRMAACLLLVLLSGAAQAAYESRFDALNFHPALEGGDYFTVHGSETLAPWQGHLGFYFEYANRPLEFSGTGGFAGTRQSVIDHMLVLHNFGSLGFTEWFTAGINIPVVAYNWFFSDEPVAAPSGAPDKAAMMGDIEVMTKFRLLDIEEHKVGVALVPSFTLPTGDVTRYAGSGHLTGGGDLVFDARFHERFNMAFNVGAVIRDRVVRHGIDMDDQLTYGLAGNIKVSPEWQILFETFGSTVIRDFFDPNTSPLEAGAGFRYYAGDTGFSFDLGGTAGIVGGIGTPRFRGFIALKWTSPVTEEIVPPPDPRISGNRIILMGKIFYDTARTTIKPVSYPVLDDVVDVLNRHPQITLVEVQGHTDARGSDAYNLELSQGRAESAVHYLVGKGVSSDRLKAVGYGESKPIADNNTDLGMSQNRRTEFVILSSLGGEFVSPPPGSPTSMNAEPATGYVPGAVSAAPAVLPEGEVPNYSYPAPTP